MSNFTDVPKNLLEGSAFNQFLVETHSIRLDFSNEVSFLSQYRLDQGSRGTVEAVYFVEDRDSTLILSRFLGSKVIRLSLIREDRLQLEFADGSFIRFFLHPDRLLDAVTIFIERRLEFVLN